MKRIFTLVLLSFCFVHLGFTQNSNVIDPELYALMNSRSGDKISVNIVLKENVDASSLNVRKAFHNKDAKRTYMVNELKTQSEKLQADVLKTLKAVERSNQVTNINCHWLTNMINCTATPDAILKIAEHPDVKAVIHNKKEYMLFDEKATQGTPTRAYNGTNVEKINAHKVWDLGYTGEGIIVAVIDTGVNADHVDLKDHLWDDGNGHHGVNTLAGDIYFPEYTDKYDITDRDGHGTHCAGTVCGDGTSGTITGMAPDAKLMAIKALGDEGEGTLESILAGVEYAVENGANVLSMSLGISGPTDSGNEVVRTAFANMLPLDVVVAAAAGNDGAKQDKYPIPYNINAPASCPPPYLSPDQTEIGGKTNVISVGAVNYSDVPCSFSSEGPVTWQNTSFRDYKLGKTYSTTTLQYDNGTYSKSYNYSEVSDCFGVMFPPTMLSGLGSVLASVSIYDAVSDAGFIEIFSGGSTPSEGTKIHSQTYQINGTKSMVDINMLTDVNIDITKNLWIIFTSYSSATPIPVSVSKSKTDANGRWVYKDSKWSNTIITNNKESIMVRANIATGAPTEEYIGLIRPDVCAPGYNIQSASNTDNNYYVWMNGTSMATPCVAGAIALLLDANPDLTPARICQVLEETSVKLSTTKSNKTGTGRINIYDAVLEVADIPLTAPVLTATAAGTSSINLSWTKAGADTYTVYRGNTVIASNLTSTTYTDSGLNAETSYCYTVKAFKGTESKTSNEACTKTLAESSGQQYRIRVSSTGHSQYGKYLYANSYTLPSDNTPTLLVGNKAESNTQIFTLEDAGNGNYYLRTADGCYVKCGDNNINSGRYWNTYAYSTTTAKTPLTLQYVDDVNFYIRDYDKTTGANHSVAMPNNNYFKVENGKIYCDADASGSGNTVTWVFELVGGTTPDPDPDPEPEPDQPGGGDGCEITFTLKDSYGDGWNNGCLVLNYNGSQEILEHTSGVTANYTLTIPQGTNVEMQLRMGNFPNEVGFTIEYADGTVIEEVTTGSLSDPANTYKNYSFTVDCGSSTPDPDPDPTPTVPNAPATLTAKAQSTSVINLSWSQVAEATSYNVYRGLSKIANVATGTTYSDTGLNQNTEYCYTVTSVNSAGESTKMNEACARTLSAVTVPGAFTLTATPQSTSSIALSWTASSGATSYDVYRATQKLASGLTNLSYTDTGLSASTQYCYSIVAVNTAGQTESNPSCATTQAENTGGGGGEGVVEIGFPTTVYDDNGRLPVETYYTHSYSQQIYTAAEIGADKNGSLITKIAFKQQNTVTTTRHIVVYMQNTNTSSFVTESSWINVTDASKVFEGDVKTLGKDQYVEIRLDTPLTYEGGNLLISVYDETGSDTNPSAKFYCYQVYDRSLAIHNWKNSIPINNMGGSTGTALGLNNAINITFEAAETIIPFPQNVKATPANIFVDQSTTISWDACAGASSYNIYVDGVNRGSSNSTSYVLSNLQYNMNPGAKVTVTAIVDGEESEPSKEVVVKVGGYFPLVINVVDHLGNPMQGVTIDLDGYDEIGNTISQTYTSDANGSVSVAKMPLPLINNCYNIEAVKSIYTGYATICDYDNAYGDIIKDVEHVVTIVMELPSPMALYADKDTYAVGESIILTWDKVTSASPQGYNLYEKYWDDGSSSFVYEKINATLIPANTNTYTVVGGLPTRGCDNTICLTAVYTESETSKGNPSVTVAKTGNGTMAGIVVDENGNPISGVSVTVQGTSCDGSGSYEYTYTTGATGKFGENMPMGIYNVFASKPGSIYNDRSAFDIEVVHGEETEVIIEMWEKGDEYEIEGEIGENPAPYVDYLGPVLPVSTGYLYSASQQIYLKEELNFASASDVKITSVSFRVYGNANAGKQDTIRIFVQNTTKAEFATLKDWANVYDDDPGFIGSYIIPSDGEWITFNFNKPLEYTGGNLLVAAHRHAPALQQSGFYVCETETRRSLCGADDYFNPVNKQTDATALYKINTIKITYTTTSPEVVVTPNPIDFGEVIVGDYWREKPDATVPVQVKGYNTKIDAITVDNPFFTIPALVLPQNTVNFDVSYNRNNTPGYKAGVLTVTPQKGLVEEVKVTATAYDPVEPDVIEKSREVVWTNDEYEDTPAFATLHDDYVLPGEIEENAKKDAVYKFTLESDAYVTAKIYNGSNAVLAFYKEDFANDDVDKDGPSSDNSFYGTGGAPVDPIDVHIMCQDNNHTGQADLTMAALGLTAKDADGDGNNWFLNHASGWGGVSGDNEKDWALGSRTYDYGKLTTENYVYTTAKYKITAMSEIVFDHIYADGAFNYWHEMFDVVVSADGENFESVHHIEYGSKLSDGNWFRDERVSLSAYNGQELHIGFGHIDPRTDEGYVTGIKIDNVCIKKVLEVDGSRGKSETKPSVRASGSVTAMMEDLLFPQGTYYVVAAAETEFTFTLSKRNVEEGIIFTGTGDWKTATNWNIEAVPQPTDDVIIRGDAVVNDNVEIKSIFIENDATLTIASTGVLEVTEGITNKIHSAFVIEDGGQLYQNAADVAATFNMNINNPATWGPDGSNHTQGWQFIASPFLDADMLNYVVTDDGDYDLYKYDGTQELEWVNYKLHHDEFSHDFADGMQGWTSLDANNDGYSWSYNNGAGNDGAAGYLSCVLRGGKTNDYLVSPKLINTYPESKLRFWIKNADDVTTTNEIEVWLSADKAAVPTSENDFVTKVATVEVTNAWQQVELLLEDYADQDDRDLMEYWIAIRSTSSASNNTEVLIDKLELANYDEPNPYETEFVLGRGYMASYEKDGTASLQGTLNYENTFNYKVAFSDAKRWENFYLIGNPFTYNINWTDFTLSNIVNGFAVVDNDGSYVYDVNAEIKVGDGIMIQTTGANPTISFAKDTRNEVADYINVVASGSEGDDNFIVSLSGDEYEGFKKLENFNENISQVYVSEYGTHYGIVNRDADVEEIEFCFDVKKMGYYTISVTPNGDFSSVILYDRVEDVETEMLTGGGYRFMAQNANDNYDRFVLKLAKKPADEDIFVYQSGDELIVNAEGLVQIIDVMGRIIYSGNQNGVNRINVSGMENSACMIRNINNNEVRTQKIVIL